MEGPTKKPVKILTTGKGSNPNKPSNTNKPSHKGKTIHWRSIAIEFSSVVFAVLLALFLNEWRQDKRNQDSVEQARLLIKHEISRNLGELDSVIVRQHEKHAKFLEYSRNTKDKPTILNAISYGGGLTIPTLEQTTWETIKLNRTIELFTLEELKLYSSLYSFQRLINEHNQRITEIFFSSDSFSSDDAKQKQQLDLLLAMLQQSLEWETEIMGSYKKAIETSPVN
jgi:hypothetical protein